MGDPLSDCSPLIGAASSFKLRLVRLLVEGGAQIDGRNSRGETALLAACRALRGEPAGPGTLKLLTYLLQNKADPNAQDRAGRTALMYACMERAGAQVASALLAAGADPSMEDHSGASALVYAINAQHQPTLKVLMDACQARGHDIIIISTETGVNGGPVTRRYLNVPPSPDTSPVSCMSPSDIVLKTGSPGSPEGENVFNFRGTGKRGSSSSSRRPSGEPSPPSRCSSPPPRQRLLSEPWLAIHALARLNLVYEEGTRERSTRKGGRGEEEEGEDREVRLHQSEVEEKMESVVAQRRDGGVHGGFLRRVSPSILSLPELGSSPRRASTAGGSQWDKHPPKSERLPACVAPPSHLRRNTLPSVTVVPPALHLPPLVDPADSSYLRVPAQVSPSKKRSLAFLPRPPAASPPASSSSSSSSRTTGRPSSLPPLPLASSLASLVVAPPASCCGE